MPNTHSDTQRDDIMSRGITLRETASLQDAKGWTEGMHIFLHGSRAAAIDYLEARGDTLKKTALLQNEWGWTEMMCILRHGVKEIFLRYVELCGGISIEAAILQNNDGNTEALHLLKFSRNLWPTYSQMRGETLNETAALRNKEGMTEGIEIIASVDFLDCLAYIQQRHETLIETANLRCQYGNTEATWIFRRMETAVCEDYIALRGRSLRNSVFHFRYVEEMETTLYSSEVEEIIEYTPKFLSTYLQQVGAYCFLNIIRRNEDLDFRHVILEKVRIIENKVEISRILFAHGFGIGLDVPSRRLYCNDFTDMICIGMSIDGRAVTRETPGFELSITTLDELELVLMSDNPSKDSLKYDSITYLCKQLAIQSKSQEKYNIRCKDLWKIHNMLLLNSTFTLKEQALKVARGERYHLEFFVSEYIGIKSMQFDENDSCVTFWLGYIDRNHELAKWLVSVHNGDSDVSDKPIDEDWYFHGRDADGVVHEGYLGQIEPLKRLKGQLPELLNKPSVATEIDWLDKGILLERIKDYLGYTEKTRDHRATMDNKISWLLGEEGYRKRKRDTYEQETLVDNSLQLTI